MGTTKLHELLAIEGNLKVQSAKASADLHNTFEKKKHHFNEKLITYTALGEGVEPIVEEQSDIQTTVPKELNWLADILVNAMDISYAIDLANTAALADVELENGTTLIKGVPATALMRLKHRLEEIRNVLQAIPTLDPAQGFVPDKDRGKGISKAREVTKNRTRKEQRPLVLAPATEKHPAQVQLITEDIITGKILQQEWSSMITPSVKSEILDNCDKLIRAVDKARARANEQQIDVAANKIGKKLFEYLFTPLA